MERINILRIKCECGRTLSSDDIYGSIVHCPACHKYKHLSNTENTFSNVFYKILPFETSDKQCRELICNYLYKNGRTDIFIELKVTEDIKRYYLPVREIRKGNVRRYVPLNDSHVWLYDKLFADGAVSADVFSKALPESAFRDLTTSDYVSIYKCDGAAKIEFLEADVQMLKIDALYGQNSRDIQIIKYLPLFTFRTNLCDFVCIGLNDDFIFSATDEERKKIERPKEKVTLFEKCMSIFSGLGLVAVLLTGLWVIGSLVYKYLTEIQGMSLLGSIFTFIVYILIALWCLFLVFLYIVSMVVIFVPLFAIGLLVFCTIAVSLSKDEPNLTVGRKKLGLQ